MAGITGAVVFFVVFGDHANNVIGQIGNRREVIDAFLDMALDHEYLLGGEFIFAVEQILRDKHLADVVQQRAGSQVVEHIGVVDAEVVGIGDHDGADVGHVGGGIEVVVGDFKEMVERTGVFKEISDGGSGEPADLIDLFFTGGLGEQLIGQGEGGGVEDIAFFLFDDFAVFQNVIQMSTDSLIIGLVIAGGDINGFDTTVNQAVIILAAKIEIEAFIEIVDRWVVEIDFEALQAFRRDIRQGNRQVAFLEAGFVCNRLLV